MFGAIFSTIGKKLFSESGSILIPLILVLGVLVVFNSDTILTKFGFETKSSLVKKVAELEGQVKNLTATNKGLEDFIYRIKNNSEHRDTVLIDYCKEISENKNKLDDKQKERQRLIDEARKTEAEVKPTVKFNSAVKVSVKPTEVVSSVSQDYPIKNESLSEKESRINIKFLHSSFDTFFPEKQNAN